jgi:hypothetical protein
MKILDITDYKKNQKKNAKASSFTKEKSHALLLKEAFDALDKVKRL